MANVRNTVFLGPSGAGKTPLFERLLRPNDKSKSPVSTVGASVGEYNNGTGLTFKIYDTPGQERYQSLVSLYIRDAELIIFTINEDIENDKKDMWFSNMSYIVSRDQLANRHCILVVTPSQKSKESSEVSLATRKRLKNEFNEKLGLKLDDKDCLSCDPRPIGKLEIGKLAKKMTAKFQAPQQQEQQATELEKKLNEQNVEVSIKEFYNYLTHLDKRIKKATKDDGNDYSDPNCFPGAAPIYRMVNYIKAHPSDYSKEVVETAEKYSYVSSCYIKLNSLDNIPAKQRLENLHTYLDSNPMPGDEITTVRTILRERTSTRFKSFLQYLDRLFGFSPKEEKPSNPQEAKPSISNPGFFVRTFSRFVYGATVINKIDEARNKDEAHIKPK